MAASDHCESGAGTLPHSPTARRSRGGGTEDFLARLEDPHSDLSQQWAEDHDRHVLARLLRLVETDFSPQTWEAFRRFAIEARPAAAVAAELGISENAVLRAKSRVLQRLREEAGGLVD